MVSESTTTFYTVIAAVAMASPIIKKHAYAGLYVGDPGVASVRLYYNATVIAPNDPELMTIATPFNIEIHPIPPPVIIT